MRTGPLIAIGLVACSSAPAQPDATTDCFANCQTVGPPCLAFFRDQDNRGHAVEVPVCENGGWNWPILENEDGTCKPLSKCAQHPVEAQTYCEFMHDEGSRGNALGVIVDNCHALPENTGIYGGPIGADFAYCYERAPTFYELRSCTLG